MQSLLIRNI